MTDPSPTPRPQHGFSLFLLDRWHLQEGTEEHYLPHAHCSWTEGSDCATVPCWLSSQTHSQFQVRLCLWFSENLWKTKINSGGKSVCSQNRSRVQRKYNTAEKNTDEKFPLVSCTSVPVIDGMLKRLLAFPSFSFRLHNMPEGKHNLHMRFYNEFNSILEDFLVQ